MQLNRTSARRDRSPARTNAPRAQPAGADATSPAPSSVSAQAAASADGATGPQARSPASADVGALAAPPPSGWGRLQADGPVAPGSSAARASSPLAVRIASTRVGRLLQSPSTLALAEFDRMLDERQARRGAQPPSPEETALRGRIQKLRAAIEGLPEQERMRRVAGEIFWGKNFTEIGADAEKLYQKARTSWAADLLGGLGALTNPLTALLLPIVVKGGWDLGRMVQPFPHFVSDEWSTAALKGLYPGATPTAYPSAEAFHDAWRALLQQQSQHELGLVQSYALSGVPHHVFEGTRDDLLVRQPFSDAAYSAAMARLPLEALTSLLLGKAGAAMKQDTAGAGTKGPTVWDAVRRWVSVAATPAVGLANPVAALGVAAGAAMGAGLYEQFPAHRAAHRPFNEASLAELTLQLQGVISTRAEHQEHHKPDHALHFSGSTRWVDRIFDEGGFPTLLNLAAYAHTQERTERIIPTSWARDPSLLEELVGEPLPLDAAHRIAAAKSALISVHRALRETMRGHDPHEVLSASVSMTGGETGATSKPLTDALTHPRLQGLFPATPTALDVYVALRREVDGVELHEDAVTKAITGAPIEEKFVRELTPRTPPEAWPLLSREQVRRAIGRLRDRYEPGRE